MAYIITSLISAAVGFILGALVFRNNKNKIQRIEDALKK